MLLPLLLIAGCGGGGGGGGGGTTHSAIAVDIALAATPHTATFTDVSGIDSTTVDSWLWNFGDPGSGAQNTSSEQNPSHQYNVPGIYTVTLSIAVGSDIRFFISDDIVVVEQPGLKINEFLAQNRGGLKDEDGDTPDWIEIYNPGPESQSLVGWTLTDDPTDPLKWSFPVINLNAQQYLIVFASGKDRTNPSAPYLHTNFQLDGDGEFLALFDPALRNKSTLPNTEFPPQEDNIGYGLPLGGTENYFLGTPTPKNQNGSKGYQGVTPPVEFNIESGIHNTPINLTLSAPMKEAEIFYSQDGFTPTGIHASPYTQPISIVTQSIISTQAIAPGYLPSKINSRT